MMALFALPALLLLGVSVEAQKMINSDKEGPVITALEQCKPNEIDAQKMCPAGKYAGIDNQGNVCQDEDKTQNSATFGQGNYVTNSPLDIAFCEDNASPDSEHLPRVGTGQARSIQSEHTTGWCSFDWSENCRKMKKKRTFAVARDKCLDLGMRLCTLGELPNTAASPCGISSFRGWTLSGCGKANGVQHYWAAAMDQYYTSPKTGKAVEGVSKVCLPETASLRFKCCTISEDMARNADINNTPKCHSCAPLATSPRSHFPGADNVNSGLIFQKDFQDSSNNELCQCGSGERIKKKPQKGGELPTFSVGAEGTVAGQCAPQDAKPEDFIAPTPPPTSSPTTTAWQICPHTSRKTCNNNPVCAWNSATRVCDVKVAPAEPAGPACSANAQYNPSSIKRCNANNPDNPEFAEIQLTALPTCITDRQGGALKFDGTKCLQAQGLAGAQATCSAMGGRLCTSEEMRAVDGEMPYWDKRVLQCNKGKHAWTGSTCGHTDLSESLRLWHHRAHSTGGDGESMCMSNPDEKLAVRCCADVQNLGCKTCPSGAGQSTKIQTWKDCDCDKFFDSDKITTAGLQCTDGECAAGTYRYGSQESCASLGIEPTRSGKTIGICATNADLDGNCMSQDYADVSTWTEADNTCGAQGMRLCESWELAKGATYQMKKKKCRVVGRVWTSTKCQQTKQDGDVVEGHVTLKKGRLPWCLTPDANYKGVDGRAHVNCCANVNNLNTCRACPEHAAGPDCSCDAGYVLDKLGDCVPEPTPPPPPPPACAENEYMVGAQKLCSDSTLKWDYNDQSQTKTCGSTRYRENEKKDVCLPRVPTYARALKTCEDIGARMCTLNELFYGYVGTQGWSLDYCAPNQYHWSSHPCSNGLNKDGEYSSGRIAFQPETLATTCRQMDSSKSGEVRVACCAEESTQSTCEECPGVSSTIFPSAIHLSHCVCPSGKIYNNNAAGAFCVSIPTDSPTSSPTFSPTSSPTSSPTFSPTSSPTIAPTPSPPTPPPTPSPPTGSPSASPSVSPTNSPSEAPTGYPTAKVCTYSEFGRSDQLVKNCAYSNDMMNNGAIGWEQCKAECLKKSWCIGIQWENKRGGNCDLNLDNGGKCIFGVGVGASPGNWRTVTRDCFD